MMVWRAPRRSAGFTFIELLASAAILALLASIAVPFVETTVKRQKEHELRIALRDIRQAIDAYKQASVGGHIAVEEGKHGYPPSLTELVAGVVDAKVPEGPKLYFLRRIPRDPFHADASVGAIDTWNKRCYESDADAPQSGEDVFDVYSSSAQTGMNGVPYKEW